MDYAPTIVIITIHSGFDNRFQIKNLFIASVANTIQTKTGFGLEINFASDVTYFFNNSANGL